MLIIPHYQAKHALTCLYLKFTLIINVKVIFFTSGILFEINIKYIALHSSRQL